ncbi:MAG TPA: nucleoside-diphosphate sugar epimerase/dehydratase [Nitrospirota bacterium]|nr:nucleoside-diphosphate sugar epimerase/dehydratase [Nitrospirota bacterium]
MPFMPETPLKRLLVLLNDAFLISLSFFAAYALRFNTLNLSEYVPQILHSLPLILGIRLTLFAIMGLYRGMWRFVGLRDLISLFQAVTLSSGLSVGLLFLISRLENFPRSVFVIDWFVVIILVGGSRFAYRLYREGAFKSLFGVQHRNGAGKRVLIVGAGKAGDLILREMLNNSDLGFIPVGLVDDNRAKRNSTIHGCRVLGHTRDIPRIVNEYAIEEIFLAIPSASSSAKRRIMRVCKSAGVTFKTLPAVGQLLNGTVTVNALREFQIEDLLGREPVKLDSGSIREYLRDKTVLITGAGGSIGSELCRQVAQYWPRRLVLYERSEFNLYQINMQLLESFPDLEVHAVIGDVVNQNRAERTLKQFKPEVVFHAAAYKHVPLMELNVEEAMRNNVHGTWVVAHLSHVYGVKKFVMVSTDKAVRPTNIMGASKRMAELICQGFGRDSKTKFVTVRFGNVLNSVGSVIPLFKQQIAKGGPVTVTHPEIYRYFMTIPESVQLIMQAGAMGKGGEIFILDMGEPVKIVDLAQDMIALSGLEPEKDIKIIYTGLRPGEKLYEELLTDGEEITSTLHEKIKVAGAVNTDWKALLEKIERLIESLQHGSSKTTIEKIREIVPEFQPEKGGSGSFMMKRSDCSDEVKKTSVKENNEDAVHTKY